MYALEQSCPFEAEARAERCESCCEANTVTPCALAWLRDRVRPANVTAVTRTRGGRRAA
ncbi:MAG: hypothetical protein IT303_03445 [Dehalococcoidia bacterium]|nr:hypothetical protein [Dehalococcoidia bacterium]